MSENILWFKELSKNDIPLVGGKGANLGELYNIEIPVPQGFVVSADAYKKFLQENKISSLIYSILQNLDVDDADKLHNAAKEVQEIILESNIPADIRTDILEAYENLNVDIDIFKVASKQALDIIKAGRDMLFVAVRSSATAEDLPNASFAGQQATFLNVKGNRDLLEAVKKCWASLFTARAIYYRIKNNFPHEKVFIAVIIQKMVNSTKSGVVFTANPVTNNENEILIEAGFGLGEAIVSGSVIPDQYVVDKETLTIKDKTIGKQAFMYIRDIQTGKTIRRELFEEESSKQKLNDFEIKKLARYSKEIEEHYQKGQDIEFAIENNNMYIVQTRPITTLKKPTSIEVREEVEEIKREEIEQVEEEKSVEIEQIVGTNHEVLLQGLAASPHIGYGPVKIIKNVEELYKIEQGDVLVTEMTNPDYTAGIQKAAGIITDSGGITSHASIVSREMNIPCVVGTLKATQVLQDNQIVTVDGTTGKIYSGKVEIKAKEEIEKERFRGETITEVKVNVDFPDHAQQAAATGADGVGLLRAEFMILKGREHPAYMIKDNRSEELISELVDGISKVAEAFKGKSVWYRTLDARTNEFRNLIGGENEPKEENPMVGWRGIRRSLDQPELLKAELEAIKRVHDNGLTNVGVMIPMVTSVEEIKKVKEYLRELGLEPCENIDFGIMVETPSAVQIIDDICKEGVDFISIGSNDLTQFTLAIDRDNALIQKLYNEMHPAVLKQIEHVIKVCRENNVETSICGQAGSREDMVEWLVKKGIDSVSANIDAVKKIRYIVYKTEKRMLLNVAREGIKKGVE